ncbi:hypothetical protein Cst_c17020 [Thermoclostridium stercorarium subsp. stercorarium DSM 8532]|uniref:Uncharacterized protein n=1 Tax=Thermoclostridium stercorarium (strain ATCC 35414 / DSM 8532 / NCIMB 11754) TaxID=1121335 RepID=L7VQN0_THES1|nr:hypothetical protein Cst_c17020 [Thermoclostridium stercorarium subsp. stercorarium DSM 8532]
MISVKTRRFNPKSAHEKTYCKKHNLPGYVIYFNSKMIFSEK